MLCGVDLVINPNVSYSNDPILILMLYRLYYNVSINVQPDAGNGCSGELWYMQDLPCFN